MSFVEIDLSTLPAPDIIQPVSYETLLAQWKAQLIGIAPELEGSLSLESDPLNKFCQVAAFQHMLNLQRSNDAGQAVMLPKARNADLDNLAALFNLKRLVIQPEKPDTIPPTPAIYEKDESFKKRILLAFEAKSSAGPEGAYLFHALNAHPGVFDASAVQAAAGTVLISILGQDVNAEVDEAILEAVEAACNARDIRPLTDRVIVSPVEIIPYAIDAELILLPGIGAEKVLELSHQGVNAYIEQVRKIGRDVTRTGLINGLFQQGVHNVILREPAEDIMISDTQASSNTGVSIRLGDRAE